MARVSKSQWEFAGELFSPKETRKVQSVSALTQQIKGLLERDLRSLWINGEVSNLRIQSSGHAYFVLKDATSQLSCVLFKGAGAGFRDLLRDGAQVLLGGDITVYEPRGQYQLRVSAVELQGAGALQAAFERLKQKLSAEGLFDPARKRILPRYPERVAFITSPTGAAWQDILHVIGRRHAGIDLILAPCRVQGDGAAAEMMAALQALQELPEPQRPQMIVLARGGGSLEDLWCFNDERLARAIADCHIPTMSAVGHEIDFTLADFVADLRAATPSAAAEIVTQGYVESARWVEGVSGRIQFLVRQRLSREEENIEQVFHRLQRVHPRRTLERGSQQLDECVAGLKNGARRSLREKRQIVQAAVQRWTSLRPSQLVKQRRRETLEQVKRLMSAVSRRIQDLQARHLKESERLRLLSPASVLDRGYSITRDAATGRIIRNARDAKPGTALLTRVQHGEIDSVVTIRAGSPDKSSVP